MWRAFCFHLRRATFSNFWWGFLSSLCLDILPQKALRFCFIRASCQAAAGASFQRFHCLASPKLSVAFLASPWLRRSMLWFVFVCVCVWSHTWLTSLCLWTSVYSRTPAAVPPVQQHFLQHTDTHRHSDEFYLLQSILWIWLIKLALKFVLDHIKSLRMTFIFVLIGDWLEKLTFMGKQFQRHQFFCVFALEGEPPRVRFSLYSQHQPSGMN